MEATSGEWGWTVVLGFTLLVSAELVRQSWFDYRYVVGKQLNGLRKAVAVQSLLNQLALAGVLALFFGIAASSLFIPTPEGGVSARGLVIRWAFVVTAVLINLHQLVSLRRRRQIMSYAEQYESGG